MIHKIGNQFYELSPTDGFGLRVTALGTTFFVPASLDITVLPLQDGVRFDVTPQMMSGAGSLHQVNIHCFFNPPAGTYTIEVMDTLGNVVDTITAAVQSGQPASTQMYYQLVLLVH
jgi:hypothetical protein